MDAEVAVGKKRRTGEAIFRWTVDEDERLRAGVQKYGASDWSEVCREVQTRDNSQCLQRWEKVLKPGLRKGQWTVEEDEKLVHLITLGFRSWSALANSMGSRSSKQCRERWVHHLDPGVRKNQFSQEEDAVILRVQEELGNKWAHIARLLPGRTEDSVKIRFKTLQRNAERKSGVVLEAHSPSVSIFRTSEVIQVM